MIFRPKIFISSTFKDNENIRQKVRDYFYSVGAEPLLYEKELTPSVLPMTYRENIKDADFVILIVKEQYGTRTDWNISGTHEEYLIAKENKIPIHVYLLKATTTEPDNPLIGDFKKAGISYYYFDNDDDLYEKLKQTTFTIAKEIMIAQIVKNNLPDSSIIKLAGNLDYRKAIQIIQIIESMKLCAKTYTLDYVSSTIISDCLSIINYDFATTKNYFINWKLSDLLLDMLSSYARFVQNHVLDYTADRGRQDYKIALLGHITVSQCSYYQNTQWTRKDYIAAIKTIFKKYDSFKKCVQELRIETDIAE